MKQLKNTMLSALMVAFGMPAFAQMYIQHNITQAPQLVADAGASVNYCVGDSVMLGGAPAAQGGTAPVTYAWSPPNGLTTTNIGNPMALPASTTTYQLLVTDAENCTSTSNATLTLVTPSATFSAAANLLVVAFTDQSTAATTWSWDFGDGGTSTLQNPTHTYAAAGTYVACLTINMGTGCQESFCDTLNVIAIGVANSLPGTHVQVYPNPTAGNQLNFEIGGAGLMGEVNIALFDTQGKLVLSYDGPGAQAIHTLNRRDLSAGTYQYRVRSGEQLLGTGKVVLR